MEDSSPKKRIINRNPEPSNVNGCKRYTKFEAGTSSKLTVMIAVYCQICKLMLSSFQKLWLVINDLCDCSRIFPNLTVDSAEYTLYKSLVCKNLLVLSTHTILYTGWPVNLGHDFLIPGKRWLVLSSSSAQSIIFLLSRNFLFPSDYFFSSDFLMDLVLTEG